MPSQVVVVNGRKVQKVAGGEDLDLGPADAQPQGPETMGHKLGRYALNPEIYSTAATLLAPETGGLSLAIPPAVGAGMSVARDLWNGEKDPLTVAGDAVIHGGLGAIPGVGGAIARRVSLAKSGVQAAHPLVEGAADILPGKAGIVAKVFKALGAGATDAAAPAATGASADALADMTLSNGTKVLSSDGLKALVQKSVELANNPAGTSPATRKALDDLISQVAQRIHPAKLSAPGLLDSLGVPTGSAAAAKAAAAKAAAEHAAGSLLWKVRMALGLTNTTGSVANDAMGDK